MRHSIIVFFLFLCSCCWSPPVDAYVFSRASRTNDVSLLERLTLPFRRSLRFPFTPVDSLVDFLASSRGLFFLALHLESLWYQELLEWEYDRQGLCENMRAGEAQRGALSSQERRLRSCLCSPFQPFLHCLAMGSQLLRDRGYANSDIQEKILTPEPLPPSTDDPNDDKDDPRRCIPIAEVVERQLVFDSHCTIPVAKLFTIKMEEFISLGIDGYIFLDLKQCALCEEGEEQVCYPICDQIIRMVEDMTDKAVGQLNTTICFNLGAIGDIVSLIFGVDKCISNVNVELFPYQRLIRIDGYFGLSSWRSRIGLDYKLEDGPECLCQLDTFKCTEYCSLKGEELSGDYGVEWELFFVGGKLMRNFNEPERCYTEHTHKTPPCETTPASPPPPMFFQ